MKLLAWTLLSGLVLCAAGCKPDAAVKRGAVVDRPTPKDQVTPTAAGLKAEQQPSPKKVQ